MKKSAARPSFPLPLLIGLICLFLGAIAITANFPLLLNWGYGFIAWSYGKVLKSDEQHTLKIVRQKFESFPGVTITEFTPYYHDIGLDYVSVKIRLQDKGDLAFMVHNPQELNDTGHVFLNQIGEFNLYADLGSQGKDHSRVPVDIHSIGDVIAHYDEIHEAVKTWQEETPKQEKFK